MGTVLQAGGGTYEILLDDRTRVTTSLRGRLKLEQRTGDRVVAGDRVRVEMHADGSRTIEAVEPRRTQLARHAPGRHQRHAKVIVANVDQVVAVFAATLPEPRRRMIDRLLVLAESNGIPAAIIINKHDLVEDERALATFSAYERAGYPVLFTSVVTGRNLAAVREWLCGRESVLTGPSGAGKSSLLNAVEPGLDLRIGAVSDAVRKGRHTTVTATLVPLECGGFVVDTPGLREVGLWGVDPDGLDQCFPEFRPLLVQCRFSGSCTHTHEPDCAVRAAVDAGDIDEERYRSYVAMIETT
ncbi:MAG: ribosome small subunit-dependent GTPase A [Gemmatimonadetes bacterium]|nr:ribosome small subunit-dependent GTPase A [Gemmatimonadota bacterium]